MLFAAFADCQLTSLDWVYSVSGENNDEGTAICNDATGNVIVTGYFDGSIDLDPGPGVQISNGYYNIFIQKLTSSGDLLWAKTIGGTNIEWPTDIKTDNEGNIYITGFFSSFVDFDPGPGIFNLTAGSTNNLFVLKLDTKGEFVWAKSIGGTGGIEGVSLSLDSKGNVCVIGSFSGQVDFDPGPGIFNLSGTQYYNNIFILKLNNNGDFVWAKTLVGGGNDTAGDVVTDTSGNIYLSGTFMHVDFDPGTGIYLMSTNGYTDGFILKLDSSGGFLWVKTIKGNSMTGSKSLCMDKDQNIYISGYYSGITDFDPGPGVYNLTASLNNQAYILKVNSSGEFLWVKSFNGNSYINRIVLDSKEYIYLAGCFNGSHDFDPGNGYHYLSSSGIQDVCVFKMDNEGNLVWAVQAGGIKADKAIDASCDSEGNVFIAGSYIRSCDFNFGSAIQTLTSDTTQFDNMNAFFCKVNQRNITGKVYQDLNQNCIQDNNEAGLANRTVLINPGNIVTRSDNIGSWGIDSLPSGTYSVQVDTTGSWPATCSGTLNFNVTHPDSFIIIPAIGLNSSLSCAMPFITISAPFLRPGFSGQSIYVQACNLIEGTETIDSAFVIIELDSLLSPHSSSLPYTALGNNRYEFFAGSISPGFCIDFHVACHLSNSAILGQTLCMQASLFPVDSCSFLGNNNTLNTVFNPCLTNYDGSHLIIREYCYDDSVNFEITNTSDYDMICFSQVRLFIDGQFVWLDSVQLQSGESNTFVFEGDGSTFRIEVDQHPLHPGNSNPSASVELCGGTTNWLPGQINILPHNDMSYGTDIYCGLVTGSYDPNDKTGYPSGIGSAKEISPNQKIEYLIRFQNTGTDTAFTVVVRDTLETTLDLFTVQPGVTSHEYSFRMYGPGILEWTFNNIMLPDSNIDERGSHGFLMFKVNQLTDLPDGTIINNSASIFFDHNPAIITNTSTHTVNYDINSNFYKKIHSENPEILIYPNPTEGRVFIDKPILDEINIYVVDNLGRVLINTKSNKLITEIDLSNLSIGIYFLLINNSVYSQTQKIIKQ
jgi:uncharacterized repeat protein (TIGR01451 family)